jgi:hypothetical protein
VNSYSVDTAWQLEFPTLGRFQMSGTLVYSEVTHALAGNLTTLDESMAYVGMSTVAVQQLSP